MKLKLKDTDKFKRVEIDIEDKRQFAQLAFLFDNFSLIEEIQKVREEFHISSELQNSDFFGKATDKELSSIRMFDLGTSDKILKDDDRKFRIKFFKRVYLLRNKFEYPPQFDDAIIQAILFNKVRSLKSTQAVLHHSDVNQSLEMTIVITPISTKAEVLEAFSQATSLMHDYKKYHPISKKIKMKKGTLEDIERDRDWYWKNINGRSPHQIAIEDNGGLDYYNEIKKQMRYAGDLSEVVRRKNDRYINTILNYEEMVRKAVNRYKENLSTA